ncbi:MAG: 3-dehydroquinate synthase [Senegalia sp. (in: firmicutes)]|uniref:3-dehydroquinate synthase n=1 Tax=Senegalia sp. (in: firmicutes) TaxID=1924098 RepID=UPI003F9DB852
MELTVNTQTNNYKIHIKRNLLKELDIHLKEYKNKKIIIITDENVSKIYLKDILKKLEDFDVYKFIIPQGEKSKSFSMAENIYDKLIKEKFNKSSLIISLGGGVVGDLAGYISATYMRGVNYIQIPTTLLSQIDSSIGGKVGINYKGIKNIIGSFYQPQKVLIDINTLKTLNKGDISSGLAEMIKYGIIKDYDLLKKIDGKIPLILNLELDDIDILIQKSLEIKKDIVEADTFEKNTRKTLNFGHTIGHGIESLDEFKRFKHGEAVALGMISESFIANKMGLISGEYYNQIKKIIFKIIKRISFTLEEKKQILKNIEMDKKNIDENIVFIFPVDYDKVDIFYIDISNKLIIESLGDDI